MRLDHLLSKEHLQIPWPVYAGCVVCQEYMPVAQTIVLRRVLMGGISTDRCLVARTVWLVRLGVSFRGSAWFWNAGGLWCWVVFGTLLGPEATGPVWRALLGVCRAGFVGFWFPGCTDRTVGSLCGGLCGVCGLGLLFENYIVDASIFYKKQFPRI